ncbi:serine hydrolase [Rugamonas sp.]|uniref:serine hydrolase domain-containing protein n=1 Tax=Rugamonas sp. TaxID=1926287 RepID=UPI0025E7D25F|nr:serine hydrolase domain-containing protein [Rugamonas sp.]
MHPSPLSAVSALALALLATPCRADDAAAAHAIAADAASITGKLDADHPLLTAGGTALTAPRDWSVRRAAGMLLLDAPETDSHVVIVDLAAGGADNAAAAIAQAWAIYRPADHHIYHLLTERAAHEGWDERRVADYDIPPNERAVIEAIASRHGDGWNVILVDAAEATASKRNTAISLIVDSARPPGYTAETFAGRAPHPLSPERIEQLRAFVAESMKQLGIPGAGLALMDHNRIVYEGGIGVRELGKPEAVDADTLFMAASNTKGMSTLLLATLVDDGKLRWDEPAIEAYPRFKLGDAAVTPKVQIRHLVCACTGLPRQDFEWLFNFGSATPATSFTLLAVAKPTSGFGEVFQYNNLMASAAGYIAAAQIYPKMALGPAYDKAMRTRIFDPLGMDSTTFDMAAALAANHASPHAMDLDGQVAVAQMANNYSVLPFRPAGGAWTSAHDLIRYVQLEANGGKLPDGSQLVSAENLLRRRAPGVASGPHEHYGMGLETGDQWGVNVVRHGGSLFGYKSDIYLLPDEGIGAVLLTNADEGRPLLGPFLRRLLELLYDGKPEAADAVRIAAANDAAERASDRALLTAPASADLSAQLAQRYRSAELGQLTVLHKGRDTIFDFGAWQSPVGSRRNADGSISFITTRAAVDGFDFVAATDAGARAGKTKAKRALIVRDGQHEYRYIEQGK